MNYEKALVDLVYELLDEVDGYKYEVNELHYDNSYREFEFSKGKRNFDSIIKRLQSINIPDPEDLLSKTMELDEFKEYLATILRIILGEKYKDDIRIAKAFVNPKDYHTKSDVNIKYKDIAGIMTPSEFVVSDELNNIQLANVVNSEISVLLKPLYENFASTIANIHYRRLPGIIATYIAIYELSKLLKQENLITEYEDYSVYYNSEYAKDSGIELVEALPKFRQKDLYEHNEHNKFGLILSDIYSTALIEKYLEDEEAFLKQYRSMIEGSTSIPDYLAYYGLNLRDKNITLKYINKIDRVEERINPKI